MRLLDTYAINCGAKIDKPFLYQSYFPLPFQKYITFQAQSKYEAKDYAYWQDVIDIVVPILDKYDIKVLQVGAKEERPLKRLYDLRGKTNFHNMSYLMQRSMLHFGPDSFNIHLASIYDIPIVALYSVSPTAVSGPHFGTSSKHVLFEAYKRIGNGKPSHSAKETPKSINTIKPEEIANAIFKLLGINFIVPFETIFTGDKYSSIIMRELVPNTSQILNNPEQPIEVRTDLHYDEKILPIHFHALQRAVVVTTKPININLLKHFKHHIPVVAYKISETGDNPEFVKELIKAGIGIVLLSNLTGKALEEKKIKYYEFGKIAPFGILNQEKINELRKDIGKLYFRSCKFIASKGNIYSSYYGEQNNLILKNDYEYQKVEDSDLFWQDLDFFTIVKKLD